MNSKQQRFVEEYLIDLNATQAAILAGYSPKTANVIGCENLSKPEISNAISRAMAERSRRTGISQDRVVQELAKIAFVNITDICDPAGQIKATAKEEDLAAMLEGAGRCLRHRQRDPVCQRRDHIFRQRRPATEHRQSYAGQC